MLRPFGIGTYPASGFLRFEEKKETKFGVVVYNGQLEKAQIDHFDLMPIIDPSYHNTEIVYYNDGENDYYATVMIVNILWKVVIELHKKDINGLFDDLEILSIADFMEKLESGEYLIVK